MARRLAVTVGFGGSPEQTKEVIKRVQIAEEVGVGDRLHRRNLGPRPVLAPHATRAQHEEDQARHRHRPVFGRSPAVLAMTAATLDELSGGRVVLGLGTSGARVIEHWHGEKFSKPIQRTKEYIEIINMIMTGEKVFYDGEIFKLQRGFRLLFEPVRKHIPIYVASISPKSMASVGAVADGWMPIYWPKSRFAVRQGVRRRGCRKGRPPRRRRRDASPRSTVVLNPDIEKAKVQAAGGISWYVTNMGDFYHEMLTRNGFAEEVAAHAQGGRRAQAHAVPDQPETHGRHGRHDAGRDRRLR